jgi:hypothetical protein
MPNLRDGHLPPIGHITPVYPKFFSSNCGFIFLYFFQKFYYYFFYNMAKWHQKSIWSQNGQNFHKFHIYERISTSDTF